MRRTRSSRRASGTISGRAAAGIRDPSTRPRRHERGSSGARGKKKGLVAGVLYARLARPATRGNAALGGAAAGAICAFLGILVSYLLGDVPGSLLALGTISSAVTGAIGGFIGALTGAVREDAMPG